MQLQVPWFSDFIALLETLTLQAKTLDGCSLPEELAISYCNRDQFNCSWDFNCLWNFNCSWKFVLWDLVPDHSLYYVPSLAQIFD